MVGKPFIVIPHELGDITTGNAAPGRSANHLGEFLDIGMVWESNGNSNLWVKGDFGAAHLIDYVAMLSANASASTTIRVRLGDTQAQVDGSAPYDSGHLPFVSPPRNNEDALYHSHLPLSSAQNRRWWRIDIGGHSGSFSAAKLIMGHRIQAERFYNYNSERGISDLGGIEVSRWGVPSVTDGLTFRTLAFTLSWISEQAYENEIESLIKKLGKRKTALICFDPEPTIWRQARTYFGWMQTLNASKLGALAPGKYQQDFSILSMI